MGSATDFGDTVGMMFQDGYFDTGVAQDLNYAVNPPAGITLPTSSTPGQPPFAPHDDWANVGLPLRAALGAGAPAISYPTDELTTEARDWIDANFPMPPPKGLADTNGDLMVDVTHLITLLGLWRPCPRVITVCHRFTCGTWE